MTSPNFLITRLPTYQFLTIYTSSPPLTCSSVLHSVISSVFDKKMEVWFTVVLTVILLLQKSSSSEQFLLGTASSSYQFEGAYLSGGKGLNNWDVFTHASGRNIADGSTGDVAVDHYNRYLEDISIMKSLGVNSYRFSISWSRILPKGKFGEINQAGIAYYNELIDALLAKGVQPFVTLCHFDIPQELEDRYSSWLSPLIQEDFGHYADVCFKYFGDRVKYWSTFNEPNFQVAFGYRQGTFPPSRCSGELGNCTAGDSETEPFIAAHNVILSHAAAVHVYRTKYQVEQKGMIGIVLHCAWFEPHSDSEADRLATLRANAFFMNWFFDPILFGRYPEEMIQVLGSTLPEFSSEEVEKLKGGSDFLGINHYTSYYVKDCMYSDCEAGPGTTRTEGYFQQLHERDGIPMGKPGDLDWQYVYPQGMEKMVTYLKDRYNNVPMIISENGYGEINNPKLTMGDFLNDVRRVEYMATYLEGLMAAMRKGADVRGYYAWSLLDNFEWTNGYTQRFGICHVDYKTLKRTPKLSAKWYSRFIAKYSKAPIAQM
ncbi:Beta-glucosidase 46 [Linum perenne]